MKKYKNQRNATSCGIIAIVNSAVWADKKLSKKEINKISKKLKYKPKIGVDIFHFENFLWDTNTSWCGFQVVESVDIPTIRELRRIFKENKAVIFGINFGDNAHVCVIVGMTKKTIKLANFYADSPISRISIEKFRKMRNKFWCIGYVIEKA